MNAGIYMEGAFVMPVPRSTTMQLVPETLEAMQRVVLLHDYCWISVLFCSAARWQTAQTRGVKCWFFFFLFFFNLTRGCSPQRLTVEAPAVVAKGQLNRQHFENMSTTLPATADSQEKATPGFALKSRRFDFCILQKTSVAQRDGSFQPRLVVISPISLLRLTQF